jgi:hypothetical protein
MAKLGADVAQLDALSRRFGSEAVRLDGAAATITALVRGVGWIGPDADRFRADWSGTLRPRLSSIAEVLRDQGRTLTDQARQQRQASDGAGVGGGPGAPGSPGPSRPGVGAPSLPDDRVTRSEFIQVDGQLGVGPVQARVYGSYLIEYLANGDIRVTEILGAQGGVGADSPGVRADLDLGSTEYRGGAMAGAAALAGLQQGRTWEIPPDQLDQLLVGIGMERFGVPDLVRDAADGGTDLVDAVTPDDFSVNVPFTDIGVGGDVPFDEINRFVDRYVNYDMPDPTREGVDLTVSGSAYAELGLGPSGVVGSGRAEAELDIEVGAFRESDGDIGVRYSHSGSVSGEIDTPLVELPGLFDHPSGSLEGSQTVEFVFDDQGRPEQLMIEQRYGTGENQTLQTATIDLDSAQLRDDAIAIRDAITNPSAENFGRVGQIDVGSWADNIEYTEADLSVDGEDYGAGAGASGIPGLIEGSADLRVEHQSVDYDYRGDNR